MLHVEVKLNRKYQIFVRSSMFLSRAIETLQHHNLPLLDSGISIHSISINEECWSVSTLQYYNIEIFGKIRHFVPKHSSVPCYTNFYESYSLLSISPWLLYFDCLPPPFFAAIGWSSHANYEPWRF